MADTAASFPVHYRERYQEKIDTIPQAISDILSTYSHIPKEEQVAHVLRLRDRAWKRFPYPCLGDLCFLELRPSIHPAYKDHVLAPLKKPSADGEPEPLFLDMSSCFGQDVRKLAHDGALVHRLWASDIESELIDIGFQMFNDADKMPRDHFLCPGNLLTNSPDDQLKVLDGKVTILHASSVFHLFSLEEQRKIAHRCLRLLRKSPDIPTLIIGCQVGNKTARYAPSDDSAQLYGHRYRHSEQSWREMWTGVCGSAEWKDKVKVLDVKTTEGEGETRPLTIIEASKKEKEITWLMFEIRITFA
ncbi:hypothetical protein F4810DRAFT_338996 [Camillea tinctor]|nr:hypothetical protein F4810DRAFT_338996 [Camillea tinctor]